MALITDARRGMWQAIDNWPALKANGSDSVATRFRQTIRFESDVPAQQILEPDFSRMPALAIRSVQVDPKWITNRQQGWPIGIRLEMWTPHWILATAEELFEEVMNALYRCQNGSGVEYVRAASGYPVMEYGDVSFEPVANAQSSKAIKTSWTVGLRTSKDPFVS